MAWIHIYMLLLTSHILEEKICEDIGLPRFVEKISKSLTGREIKT